MLVALALGVAACGAEDTAVGDPTPVVQAEALPYEDSVLTEPAPPAPPDDDAPDTGPVDEPTPSGTSSPAPAIGPTNADAAAFVRGDARADLGGIEHVVVDLDADSWPEVVVTGIRERRGVLRVAWWTADGYEVLAEDVAGPGRRITDLRAADVTADGRTELLVAVEGEGLASLAVWTVLRRGAIERLEADGGCHDGSHVYGVTRVRLQDAGAAPPAIVADCDDSPLPVADWSEQRWVWSDGSYTLDLVPEPVEPTEGDAADDDGPDDGDADDGGGEGDDGGD